MDAPDADTHPVELAVQSMLGPSLEKLNGQLEALHQSQAVLMDLLRLMQAELGLYEQRCLTEGGPSNEKRVAALTARIKAVNKVLDGARKRVAQLGPPPS